MAHAYWPLFDLRLRIGDLLLRPLTEADLDPLVRALSPDVELDPDSVVFDGQSTTLARGTITHQAYWRSMGNWKACDWSLNFGGMARQRPPRRAGTRGTRLPSTAYGRHGLVP